MQSVMLLVYKHKSFPLSFNLTTKDYTTAFCTREHVQNVTALYLNTQGVQKAKLYRFPTPENINTFAASYLNSQG
jgi:hypothetical protein